MSTIIFAVDSSLSHYYASLKLAEQLSQKEHKIIYIATDEGALANDLSVNKAIVESRGYAFLRISNPISNVERNRANSNDQEGAKQSNNGSDNHYKELIDKECYQME